jgi:hypothetical protein
MTAQTTVEHTPTEVIHDLPTFPGLQIEDWQPLSNRQGRLEGVAEVATSLITMSDGARYIKRDIQAAQPATDVRIEVMTPLGTRVSGANTALGELLVARSGSEVSIIGSNQSCSAMTSLAEDAWAANLIMNEHDSQQGIAPGERPVISFGKSRGGMGGNGKIAYAPHQSRKILLAVHEDPSLQHATGVIETLSSLTPLDLMQEGSEIIHGLLERRESESPLERFKRFRMMSTTIGLSPAYLRAQWHTGRALWRGDSGIFLQHMPVDQALVTLMMNRNKLNHREEFGRRSERLPHSHIIDRNYKHMAMLRSCVELAGAEAVAESVRRLRTGEEPRAVARIVATQLQLRLPPK